MKRLARRPVLLFLIVWLLICLFGEVWNLTHPPEFTSLSTTPREPVVQLRYATLPSVLRVLAVHYWFVAFDPATGRWHRWDLWQNANEGPTSWGHVNRDLMHPDRGVGGGAYQISHEWHGEEAARLVAVLAKSSRYPDRDRYLPWPGPNSNTYIAWVLREAGVAADLHPMAIGKDYVGIVGADVSPTQTGYQVESPVVGAKAGLKDGVEVHLLCLTFGIDVWPPAYKTPLGRLGFRE